MGDIGATRLIGTKDLRVYRAEDEYWISWRAEVSSRRAVGHSVKKNDCPTATQQPPQPATATTAAAAAAASATTTTTTTTTAAAAAAAAAAAGTVPKVQLPHRLPGAAGAARGAPVWFGMVPG